VKQPFNTIPLKNAANFDGEKEQLVNDKDVLVEGKFKVRDM